MSDRDVAFAEYFAARSSAMRATAYLLCGDWHRAEDLVQSAFTKLYTRWSRVQRHDSLDPYMRKVLISSFIDETRWGWWRRERPHDSRIERAADPEPADDRVTLMRALAQVPPRQRAVLVLRYWQDLSVDDTAKRLLDEVLGVIPDGYTAPDGRVGDGISLRDHQAIIQDDDWHYLATVALRKDGRTGGLIVEVHEPGANLPADVCKLAQRFWGRGGTCEPLTVGGRKAGVIRDGAGTSWAAYRHTDGTVVYIRQSTATTYGSEAGFQPLPGLPLTDTELAALATDDRFH